MTGVVAPRLHHRAGVAGHSSYFAAPPVCPDKPLPSIGRLVGGAGWVLIPSPEGDSGLPTSGTSPGSARARLWNVPGIRPCRRTRSSRRRTPSAFPPIPSGCRPTPWSGQPSTSRIGARFRRRPTVLLPGAGDCSSVRRARPVTVSIRWGGFQGSGDRGRTLIDGAHLISTSTAAVSPLRTWSDRRRRDFRRPRACVAGGAVEPLR